MKKHIDIKEPCSENWEAMTPTRRGAFCESCALEVYDFTNHSGDEIRDILKLNLGSHVCGKINPSQLESLNVDFTSWQMNARRSFQSALVFALIVAFGMTLFSCEEDEEKQKIGSIQQVGMSFLATQAESTYRVGKTVGIIAQKPELPVLPIQPEAFIEIPIIEYEIWDEMLPEVQVVEESLLIDDEHEREVHIAGGISYSSHYTEYLSVDENIQNHSKEEVEIEFEAFAYPNPAKEQTTLRIMLPKKLKVQVDLFTMNGQLVQSIHSKRLQKGENNLPIDLIDLPVGTYLLSIRSEEFNESVRFVKL